MDKLFAKIKKENLEPDEKSKILYSLKTFVAENPAHGIRSPFYKAWFVLRQRTFAIPVAILLILILTGGTVFAANNSLPGDMLYSIKKLNENIQSSVALGPEAKAVVEASHAISRLTEVEKIVTSNGQLSSSTSQEIQSRFEAQSQQAINNIDQLSSSGQSGDASKIQSDFHKSLSEHERVITELSNSSSTRSQTRQELINVVSNIHSQLDRISGVDNGQGSTTNSGGIKNNNSKNKRDRASDTNATNTNNSIQTQGEVKGAATSTPRTGTQRRHSSESDSEGND
jgi:hypothetical protein